MKLSVVIPCYNAASTIGDLLGALAEEVWDEPWEVIVVDNRSDDMSIEVVERYMGKVPGLRVVKAHERRGKSYARNTGVAAAKGEAIAFCDADDIVGTGWLKAIGTALETINCVACRVDFTRLNEPSLAIQHGYHEQHHGLQKAWYPPYLQHAGGGTLGVKRAVHDKIGGFDEAFPALQDTDYCFRIQLTGYQLQWVPEAVIHVRCRPGPSARFQQIREWALYNVLLSKRHSSERGKAIAAWKEYLKNWIRLLELLPRVRTKLAWNRWMWYLGWQVGVFHGSVKFRTSPLPLPFRPAV
jgi:glycosyltransferase involved in cell wall biosynthesis